MGQIKRQDILKIFVFDCWIGNFDKKDPDYVLDENEKLWSIDYQLWGPRDDSGRTLGYFADTYEFTPANIRKYCVGDLLRPILEYDKTVFDTLVRRIEKLSDRRIRQLVNRYPFCSQDHEKRQNINQVFVEFLQRRRDELRGLLKNCFGVA